MITLTESMRDWLRAAENATMPFYDMVTGFMRRFGLTPDQAAPLLAQWVRESV